MKKDLIFKCLDLNSISYLKLTIANTTIIALVYICIHDFTHNKTCSLVLIEENSSNTRYFCLAEDINSVEILVAVSNQSFNCVCSISTYLKYLGIFKINFSVSYAHFRSMSPAMPSIFILAQSHWVKRLSSDSLCYNCYRSFFFFTDDILTINIITTRSG